VFDLKMSSVGARFRAGVVLAASMFVLMLAVASAAGATTWVVTSKVDGASTCPSASSCTLRGAVEEADNGDVISLPAGTYTLNGAKGPVDVEADVSIVGGGAGTTTITASPAGGLLEVEGAEVSISGITFKGGTAGSSGKEGYGGAIENNGGRLSITNSAFVENTAGGETTDPSYDYGGYGGAIYNDNGELIVAASSFTSNTAGGGENASSYAEGGFGGAIYSDDGLLEVNGSSFSKNIAAGSSKVSGTADEEGGDGGAIYSEDGVATISGSGFSANSAQGGATDASTSGYSDGGEGGSLYGQDGTTSISASTFSANTAGGAGYTSAHGGEVAYGGALAIYDGTTSISASTFSSNTADAGLDGSGSDYGEAGRGGAIAAGSGSLELSGDNVSANTAAEDVSTKGEYGYGGGLYADDGVVAISQSTFSSNSSPKGYGGGLYAGYGRVTLSQSTIGPDNTAEDGGGLYHNDGPAGLTNMTIDGNTASEYGGGIYNEGPAQLANVSLVANAAKHADGGGNLYVETGTVTLHDSLIAAGTAPTGDGNCGFSGGRIASDGYNAEDSNQCTLSGPGVLLNASLNLGPLQSNGGPTATVALGAGSQAIDAGDPSGCTDAEGNSLTVDQRGVSRPQGPRCDIGAFEVEVPAPAPTPTPTPNPTPTPKPTAPSVTSFATSLSVKLSSGVGTLTAGCGALADESCTFTLALYATVKSAHASSTSKRVKVGTVSGKIQGGHVGKLSVKLNATGRSLLKHGSLHLEAKGTVKDTAGIVVQFHRSITIKKKK
jgi:hypothetical protein